MESRRIKLMPGRRKKLIPDRRNELMPGRGKELTESRRKEHLPDILKSRPVVQVRDYYKAGRHFVWMILCFKKEMTFGDQLSESPSAILVKLIRITFPS
ncbi:MAG TPA: hypothetical protein DCX23_00275 [Lachnospiraceae bacterium]|nr:hypothetical protein [Lachnospiraceae bacterium]